MARNRQRAKERQARRKAREQQGDGAKRRKDAAAPKPGDDPRAEAIVNSRTEPVEPPELSESERLRAGAPPEDTGFSAEVLEYEQDLDESAKDTEHFDPDQDRPAGDLAEDGSGRAGAGEQHKHRPRFVQFLIAVSAELRRVQWPDRQALTTLTGVVLGFVLIAGGYLGLLDAIASRVIQAIL
ncbi:MAG: preprotein translocase subunit SecE [Thermoleophilaceae bacterium]